MPQVNFQYIALLLKCKISSTWLVETAHIFLIFLIATIQISIGIWNARKRGGIYKTFENYTNVKHTCKGIRLIHTSYF